MCDVEHVAQEIVERGLPLDKVVDELRRCAVRMALAKHNGNRARAARSLSMDRSTFRRLEAP
jgi:DNA-binding NtrC family response regulator